MGTNVLEVSLKSTAHVHVCHLECHACTLQYLFTRTCICMCTGVQNVFII